MSAKKSDRKRSAAQPMRLWLRMLSCATLVEGELRRRLREEFSITLPQFDVLAQLDAGERDGDAGLTMSTLSERLMVTNGNVTGLVERLVTDGLVTREPAPEDRRRMIVSLTTTGRKALATIVPAHEAWITELFADMEGKEVRRLHELLGDLRDSVRAALPGAGT